SQLWLGSRSRARIAHGKLSRPDAPEEIRRCRDKAARRDLARDLSYVGIDAEDGGRDDGRGNPLPGVGQGDVAVEGAAVARGDLPVRVGHSSILPRPGGTLVR